MSLGMGERGDRKGKGGNQGSPTLFTLLFVCTGNICRSPMAVGILRSLLSDELRDKVKTVSAGIAALSGEQATDLARAVAAEAGIDVSDHRAQQLTKELLEEADLVLSMSIEHNYYVKSLGIKYLEKTFLLKEFGRHLEGKVRERSIFDPYGGSEGVYRECFREIQAEIERILPGIERLVREKLQQMEGNSG